MTNKVITTHYDKKGRVSKVSTERYAPNIPALKMTHIETAKTEDRQHLMIRKGNRVHISF